jgi:hydrogenase maturation protein HypF
MLLLVESFSKKRVQLKIGGIVQGVGFRPFVYKLAKKYSLYGFVLNNGEGVVIEIEGDGSSTEKFVQELKKDKPSLSRIDLIESKELSLCGDNEFQIIATKHSDTSTMLSADISLCDDCYNEMHDSKDRRYNYPFINCTNCGPRYTITKALPYDRVNTSMSVFPMCKACEAEYNDPENRRYHAQPISCFDCGPNLSIKQLEDENLNTSKDKIATLAQAIKDSEVVALKGLGGFHIVCDAMNDKAVMELRLHKHRVSKPLAVMFKNISEIKKVCILSAEDEALILSKERPIVIVQKKSTSNISKHVAPNIDKLGVFLPYTPLHELLLSQLNTPLIATSANLSDEPIIRGEEELFDKLSLVVQKALSYDREIVHTCDDSVVMNVEGEKLFLRLARGYAPKSFFLSQKSQKKVLALGANQKSTISLAFDNNIILSPHIGDLNSLGAFEYFLRTLDTFKEFYNFEPDVIVCDKHPKYETTMWAKEYTVKHPHVELIEVQHHYAHALACIAEKKIEKEVLAFCFDGTGYGDDNTLWGGEVLLASKDDYKRVFHLEDFSLLGGEKAVKEPRRVALSILLEQYTTEQIVSMDLEFIKSFSEDELKTLILMRSRSINSPKSSSIGRLFDAVYAFSEHLEPLAYEGESGLILESEANKYPDDGVYSFILKADTIDYKQMIEEILNEKNKKIIASKFINTIVLMIEKIAMVYKDKEIVLSGGVFQNKVLLKRTINMCRKNNICYHLQTQTPINDGGISLGQVFYALEQQKKD